MVSVASQSSSSSTRIDSLIFCFMVLLERARPLWFSPWLVKSMATSTGNISLRWEPTLSGSSFTCATITCLCVLVERVRRPWHRRCSRPDQGLRRLWSFIQKVLSNLLDSRIGGDWYCVLPDIIAMESNSSSLMKLIWWHKRPRLPYVEVRTYVCRTQTF